MKGKYIGFSFGLTGQQTLYIRTLALLVCQKGRLAGGKCQQEGRSLQKLDDDALLANFVLLSQIKDEVFFKFYTNLVSAKKI